MEYEIVVLILALYLFYFVFALFAAAVSLWSASRLLDFKYKSLRKALRLILFYVAIVSVPVSVTILFVASNVENLRFDEISMFSLGVVINLMHLMFLLMIKNSYEEKWPKVLIAYGIYLATIFFLFLILFFATTLIGPTLWETGLFNIQIDWDGILGFLKGIGRFDVPNRTR